MPAQILQLQKKIVILDLGENDDRFRCQGSRDSLTISNYSAFGGGNDSANVAKITLSIIKQYSHK